MVKNPKVKNSKNNHIGQHFESVLKEMFQHLSSLFNVDYLGINLIDEKDKTFEKFFSYGEWSEGKKERKKLEMDVCKEVVNFERIVNRQEESILCLPMKIRGSNKILGAIFFHSPAPHYYSDEDENVMLMFSNILVFGIWYLEYYLLQLNKRSGKDFEYIEFAAMSVNLRETINEVLEKIIKSFNAQHATVYRFDKETQKFFYPIATKGVSKQFWSHIPRKDGVAAHTAQTTNPIFLNDINGDPLFSKSSFAKNEKVKSAAATSLGGEGVLFLSYSESHTFTDSEKKKFIKN